jgi:hypothetical protein
VVDDAKVQYGDVFVAWIMGLSMSKRAADARDHLLQHGSLTTEQLSAMGYQHPPRAIRDLRDAGATVAKGSAKSRDGKNIASYTLIEQTSVGRAGRVSIPKKFRDSVNESHDFTCGICSGKFEGRELQCDHRVPFEIGGDAGVLLIEDYLPLCASDNRSKSWSCEHCPNWVIRDPETCKTCFWAFPENYEHIETRPERRISLVFQGGEAVVADCLKEEAQDLGISIQQLAKNRIARHD